MLIFTEEHLREVPMGTDAVQAFVSNLESRDEINCLSVSDYLIARRSLSNQQQEELDQVVSVRLQRGVASCQQHQSTWHGHKAVQITKNWLATFADSSQVPHKISLIAAQGVEDN
ncbi:hypothetical protein [Lacticaseibacillus paracasei]|uniref:hypothetical protein n=1 Tax=Lacticaseibacillus paracasei TaxID=1597 RepID=UPI0039FBBEBF